ncbi:MAG: agmatinase [Flavobacteriales bacterium]|nr:agmatinase [Flavobacteriales bacterium]MDG1765230.1 agmatinase [Flavobacteriales bacterium]
MEKRVFAGVPEAFGGYDKAKVVLIPVPYDGTSTWVKGADKGPEAFLNAAENMELYDIETDSEVYEQGVFLADPVLENASPESMTAAVKAAVSKGIQDEKLVSLFGGEHSISIGSIQAHKEAFPNLTVLQIDAHADLRPSYHGSECNHACALHWASKNTNLIQVGIRSMDISEKEHMDYGKTFFAQTCHEQDDQEWMDRVLELCTEDVYITIDLDGFDPSVLPSTGTPEPGGLHWYQTLRLLKSVIEKRRLVGFDIVELAPNPEEKASDFVASKLYYKILSYHFNPHL